MDILSVHLSPLRRLCSVVRRYEDLGLNSSYGRSLRTRGFEARTTSTDIVFLNS